MQTLGSSPYRLLRRRLQPRDAALWFIILGLAGITLLHYMTDIHLIPYHSIYRSLYYLPIAVAAVRYGRKGGILTALSASALYLPHVVLSWSIMPNDAFNDLLENAVFLFVGALAGTLADAERRQRQRAQAAAAQLVDANAQLQAQAELAERTRASLASILESLDSGVATVDRSGTVNAANSAAKAWLGGDEQVAALLRQYVATGAQSHQHHTAGGRALGLHGAPLIGARGERIGTVVVLDDLTEQRALEAQVRRSERLAALGRLAGGLAHEIRNPLGIVRAAAQLLHQQLGSREGLGEYTRVIQSEVDRVDRLIEQLLDYARPRPLNPGIVDVAAVVGRATELARAYALQRDVHLEHDAGEPALTHGDEEQLHQALVNLLLNAIQATPAGGRVSVAVAQHEHGIGIETRDSGRGIAPDDLPHIFDPFFTTRDDGTGLGLSIVQQIVQEHGGTIDAHSAVGRGTTFQVVLPAAVAEPAEQA